MNPTGVARGDLYYPSFFMTLLRAGSLTRTVCGNGLRQEGARTPTFDRLADWILADVVVTLVARLNRSFVKANLSK